MAQFKIRRLTWSDTAAGVGDHQCIAVFLFDHEGDPIDLLLPAEALNGKYFAKTDLAFVNVLVEELRDLVGDREAIAEFVATRLREASLSLVLEDPVSIEEADRNAAWRRAAIYLTPRVSSASRSAR